MTRLPKSQAKANMQRCLDRMIYLRQVHSDESPEFYKWDRNTRIAIVQTFGQNSKQSIEFHSIKFRPTSAWMFEEDYDAFQAGIDKASALLESIIDEISLYWQDEEQPLTPQRQESSIQPADSRRVFVVHGRDEGTLNIVARFLEGLKLEIIVLQEQASEGRTIIEKIEEYADVSFAVVLCTPDDQGRLANEPGELKPRPRQNVILELGFFLASIGRNRVCALLKDDVEIPSDYAGVIYIRMDSAGGWRTRLFKELESAGLSVDPKHLVSS